MFEKREYIGCLTPVQISGIFQDPFSAKISGW